MRWFYEGRACDTDDLNPKRNTEKAHELGTYSGKIEFVSQSLMAHEPDDLERPPLPRYIRWEGHIRIGEKYPFSLSCRIQDTVPQFQYDTHAPGLQIFRVTVY
jgi:trimethylamine-N-oxide reductase (cytochrome c)